MGVKDQARRVAASASVALATSGLSSCHDNGGGVVDPAPPPLQCNDVGMGQSLTATATRAADTLNVVINNTQGGSTWEVDQVGDVVGASLLGIELPAARSYQPLQLTLRLATDTTTQASFSLKATLFGTGDETCAVQRTFHLDISSSGVQISSLNLDMLPLPARQGAEIVLVRHAGRVVELAARTPFEGGHEVSWRVSEGELDAPTGSPVRWTLPAAAGIYQAELVIDFGDAGLAVDVLMLEVV